MIGEIKILKLLNHYTTTSCLVLWPSLAPALAVTFTAVYWPGAIWFEWNFTFLTTRRASCLEHLPSCHYDSSPLLFDAKTHTFLHISLTILFPFIPFPVACHGVPLPYYEQKRSHSRVGSRHSVRSETLDHQRPLSAVSEMKSGIRFNKVAHKLAFRIPIASLSLQ